MLDINRLCKYFVQQGKALPYNEAYELGQAAVEAAIGGDRMLTIDTTSILTALYHVTTLSHEDAPAMIAGLSAAVFKFDIGESPQGFLNVPGLDYAMENCGMGGDTIVTPNVSCLSAICAASAGITMIKHGSRSHSDAGKSGSSDFLEKCGIPLDLEVERTRSLIKACNIGYIDAVDARFKRIHKITMKESNVSHLNHVVGPITSPVNPLLLRRRVLGVNQLVSPEVVAKAYRILNEKGVTHMEHALIVRGRGENKADSMDEVSIASGGTELVTLRDGKIHSRFLFAEDFGLRPTSLDNLRVPSGQTKGSYSMAILRGEVEGPAVDFICANAALLFHLADPSLDLRTCAQNARKHLSSGKAYAHLQNIRSFLGN